MQYHELLPANLCNTVYLSHTSIHVGLLPNHVFMALFSNPLLPNLNFYWHQWEDYKCQSRQITAWLHPHYYRIVTGKWPWVLATKAPGYEDTHPSTVASFSVLHQQHEIHKLQATNTVETRLQVGPVCSTFLTAYCIVPGEVPIPTQAPTTKVLWFSS